SGRPGWQRCHPWSDSCTSSPRPAGPQAWWRHNPDKRVISYQTSALGGGVAIGFIRPGVRFIYQRFKFLCVQFRQIAGTVVAAQFAQRLAHAFDATVHRVHVVQHPAYGPGDRVRHVAGFTVGIKTHLLGHGLALAALCLVKLGISLVANNDPTGNAHHGGTFGYRLGYHRIGTDLGIPAHGERPQYLGAGSHYHAVLQRRMALALVPAGAAQGHALVQSHVIADLGGFPYHYAHAVVDEETPPHLCSGVDLDTGQPAAQVGQHARQQAGVAQPEPMCETVEPDSVQSRIAQQHLPLAAGSRVTMEYAGDIFSHAFKHVYCLRAPAAWTPMAFWVSGRMPRRMFIST